MTDKSNDPVALWQKMIGEMEKGFNSFATRAMETPEFSQAMNRAGGAAAGAQKQFGDLMEKYLLSLNLPSREQMTGIAERLQSIENQLNEIKALMVQINAKVGGEQAAASGPSKPPRTKRPPAAPKGETA